MNQLVFSSLLTHTQNLQLTSSRRHIISPHKEQRPIDILENLLSSPLVQIPSNHWCDRTDPEKVQQRRVAPAYAIQTIWTDQSPNHRRAEHRSAIGTGEGGGLVGTADVVDVAEHPEGNASLSEGSEDGGEALGEEDGAWC